MKILGIIIFVAIGLRAQETLNIRETELDRMVASVVFKFAKKAYLRTQDWVLMSALDSSKVTNGVEKLKSHLDIIAEKIKSDDVHEEASIVEWAAEKKEETQEVEAAILHLEKISEGLTYLTEQDRRVKRGAFNFMGTILRGLTGVPDREEIDEIHHRVEQVENVETGMYSAIEHTISALNITSVRVEESVRHINGIVSEVEVLQDEIITLHQRLVMSKEQAKITEIVDKLEAVLTKQQAAVLSMQASLEKHYKTIDTAARGHLDMEFINPSKLADILTKIQKILPSDTEITYPVSHGAILEYYKSIRAEVMVENGIIYILAFIPLRDKNFVFNLYQVFSLGAPHVTENRDRIKTVKAKLIIDTEFFAATPDESQYIILEKKEFEKCVMSSNDFCDIDKPIFKSQPEVYGSCSLSLFFGGV